MLYIQTKDNTTYFDSNQQKKQSNLSNQIEHIDENTVVYITGINVMEIKGSDILICRINKPRLVRGNFIKKILHISHYEQFKK